MRITINTETDEQAEKMVPQILRELIDSAQETGHCVCRFQKVNSNKEFMGFVKKTKAGYSIKTWEDNKSI